MNSASLSLRGLVERFTNVVKVVWPGASSTFVANRPSEEISQHDTISPGIGTFIDEEPPYEVVPTDKEKLFAALDRFFAAINFQTEAESIRPENVAKTKAAFETLIQEMDWKLVGLNFKALLKEKSGDKEFRDDGETPNWYHEFRAVITDLDFLRSDLMMEQDINKWGGIETKLSADLRHDSGEDFGHGKQHIYAELEKAVHIAYNTDGITDPAVIEAHEKKILFARHRAVGISSIVDMMTRKDPVYDPDTGQIKVLPNGKKERAVRFDGDMNAYFNQLFGHPFAGAGKQMDTIEGISTRIIPSKFLQDIPGMQKGTAIEKLIAGQEHFAGGRKFSKDDNIRYADEKRRHYGRAAVDKMLSQKYPELRHVFKTLDCMAGVTLVILETVNDYFAHDPSLNPRLANPMSIERYLPQVRANYLHTPPAFRADHIMVERLETIAKTCLEKANEMKEAGKHLTREGNRAFIGLYRMAEVLENIIYPAMIPLIGDRRGTLLENRGHMDYNTKPDPYLP